MRKQWRGFTLIELLIVVAIIAILAAIAVPNFLEAQVRSKVSRVHADLRSIGIACESYCVDKNDYPTTGEWLSNDMNAECLDLLTSPIAYLTMSRIKDPFNIPLQNPFRNPHGYFQYHSYTHPDFVPAMHRKAFIIFSFGPDRRASSMDWIYNMMLDPNAANNGGRLWTAAEAMSRDNLWSNGYDGLPNGCMVYDPTNGTKSQGDIGRTQGDVPPGLPTVIGGGVR